MRRDPEQKKNSIGSMGAIRAQRESVTGLERTRTSVLMGLVGLMVASKARRNAPGSGDSEGSASGLAKVNGD